MINIMAKLKYYHVAPRKVRLAADLVRGKKVKDAIVQLKFLKKESSNEIAKLLKSAVSNAKHNFKVDTNKEDLYVKEIRVDDGPSLKRWRPKWHGTMHPFRRRTSHVTVILSDKSGKNKKK